MNTSVVQLAMKRPMPISTPPKITSGRAPIRSLSAPAAKPETPMTMKAMVIAPEMPARVHPVSSAIGAR